MINYLIPMKTGVDEPGYQRVVAAALKDAGHVPQLVRPRAKYRGSCWAVYSKS